MRCVRTAVDSHEKLKQPEVVIAIFAWMKETVAVNGRHGLEFLRSRCHGKQFNFC